MSVLVTTVDGYHIFASSGKHLTALEGHRVECFVPGSDGTWLAVVDRHAIWSHGRDGTWTPIAESTHGLTGVVGVGDVVYAGTANARVLCGASSATLEPVESFDTVAGRDAWHAVGMPLQVRSMTATFWPRGP